MESLHKEKIIIVKGWKQRFRTGQWDRILANTIHAAKFVEWTTKIEFWFKVDSTP